MKIAADSAICPFCFADADLADHDRGDYAQVASPHGLPPAQGFARAAKQKRTASGERRRPM
jgi:hypothetical protein